MIERVLSRDFSSSDYVDNGYFSTVVSFMLSFLCLVLRGEMGSPAKRKRNESRGREVRDNSIQHDEHIQLPPPRSILVFFSPVRRLF